MGKGVVLGVVAVLLFSPITQAVDFSVGGEFTRGIGVQNVVLVHSGPFGLHIGGAVDTQGIEGKDLESAVFGAYASFLLKYYLVFDALPLSVYGGAGFVGVLVDFTARAESETIVLLRGRVLGQQIVAGAELSVPDRPVALYAGLSYLDLPELSVTLFGQTTHVPIATRGVTFHIGVRLDIRL
jgi:hypothetical protein